MAKQKRAAGTKEAGPIVAEIKTVTARTRELEEELIELKAQTKSVNADLEAAWNRLRQLNEEQIRGYPLFEKSEGEATNEEPASEQVAAPQADTPVTPAAPEGRGNWRTVPVADLERFGLAKKIVAALGEGGMGTIGDISKLNEKGLSLTDVKGIGEKAAEKIEAALDDFWKEWGPVDEGGGGEAAPPADEAPAPPADALPDGPTSGLTDDQVRELAQRLEGSNANVYDAAEAVAGVRPSEGILGHLRSIAGLMRCPNCGVWKEAPDFAIDEADPECLNGVPLCFECLNADVANRGPRPMSTTQTLTIHGWVPTRLNQLIGHRRKAGALKKRDRIVISNAARFQGIVKATGPRRVGIELTFGKGDRSGDPDAYYKSALDALVHAGLLTGDPYKRVQFTQPVFRRDLRRKTVITLEDVEAEGLRKPKERMR